MSKNAQESFYGYIPTLWICYTFVVLFSLTSCVHVVEAFYFKPRLYWLIPTVILCGFGEAVGWSARLQSSKNPANYTVFMIQLVITVIAPTFLTAALYTILGRLIQQLGLQYSRLNAKAYIIIFVSADVLALMVQSIGGGIAAGTQNKTQSNLGSHIMVGGIFLQLAGITLYSLLAAEVLLRFYFRKPVAVAVSSRVPLNNEENDIDEKRSNLDTGVVSPRVGMMVIGLVLATVLVYIRTVYRTIELLGGWNGRIITTEIYFNLLDATPIALAMFVLNVFHPGALLGKPAQA